MGKYNFSAMKFDELERRLAALETVNNELRKENAALRKDATENPRTARRLSNDIYNINKVIDLFGISIIKNAIKRNEDKATRKFASFYKNVFTYLNPILYEPPSGIKQIYYTPMETLTDDEYRVYISTIEKIVDVMYEGKQQLEKLKRNTPENVSD